MPDLKEANEEFRQAWNQNPKPFIWTATVEDIIKKIERARVTMEQIKPRPTLPRGKKEGGLTVKLFKGHYTSKIGRLPAPCLSPLAVVWKENHLRLTRRNIVFSLQ
ncbi:MAG: hypothetical protein ACREYE_21865 [Gammaproteobacteria bacterium]